MAFLSHIGASLPSASKAGAAETASVDSAKSSDGAAHLSDDKITRADDTTAVRQPFISRFMDKRAQKKRNSEVKQLSRIVQKADNKVHTRNDAVRQTVFSGAKTLDKPEARRVALTQGDKSVQQLIDAANGEESLGLHFASGALGGAVKKEAARHDLTPEQYSQPTVKTYGKAVAQSATTAGKASKTIKKELSANRAVTKADAARDTLATKYGQVDRSAKQAALTADPLAALNDAHYLHGGNADQTLKPHMTNFGANLERSARDKHAAGLEGKFSAEHTDALNTLVQRNIEQQLIAKQGAGGALSGAWAARSQIASGDFKAAASTVGNHVGQSVDIDTVAASLKTQAALEQKSGTFATTRNELLNIRKAQALEKDRNAQTVRGDTFYDPYNSPEAAAAGEAAIHKTALEKLPDHTLLKNITEDQLGYVPSGAMDAVTRYLSS